MPPPRPPWEPPPQADQEPDHAGRAVGPGARTPEVRTCVRWGPAREECSGPRRAVPSAGRASAPSRKGRLAFPAAPSGLGKWPNNRAALSDRAGVCVCTLGVCPCTCVYPERGELGEQGEDPLLGFPRRQAPGCIISCSSHSTTPLRPRKTLASSPYRKQAQRGPPAANGVCAWLSEGPDGFCHLPAVGLGWRLGRGVGGGRKTLLRARFCSSQKACMHTALTGELNSLHIPE